MVLRATISPSEDPAKVEGALRNVIGDVNAEVRSRDGSVSLTSQDAESLVRLRDQLRDRHVRGAARKRLLHEGNGREASLMLNRQAAAAGVLALCGSPEESPLGPIYLTIESDKLEKVIDWLTSYEG